MNTYKVALTRIYLVSVKANNVDQALRFSEYYLGNCPDLSSEEEQIKKNFTIDKIEMVYNEADNVDV